MPFTPANAADAARKSAEVRRGRMSRQVADEALDRLIDRLVAEAPPLSDDQARRVAALLLRNSK